MKKDVMTSSAYEKCRQILKAEPRVWLVTGVAGFIGSNLLETLLSLGQKVIGLDNFMTGKRKNLDDVKTCVTPAEWRGFDFMEGDIRNLDDCKKACRGAEFILHQAALGSVPRSIEDPVSTHEVNVTGFQNMLIAANEAGAKRFVYASSSSVYGDHPQMPKVESETGKLLSPYALSKYADELYADVFGRVYGLSHVGLRYFNVFGKRQDPEGAYAAVIPKWISSLIKGEAVFINGTGETSRDFCYVANVVQANLLAASTQNQQASGAVCNVAVHARTDLNELFATLKRLLTPKVLGLAEAQPVYRDFREGDIMHSWADISRAKNLLGYAPTHSLEQGLSEALDWYVAALS